MTKISTLIFLVAFFLLVGQVTTVSSVHSHIPRIKVKQGASTNWSGYAALTNLNSPQAESVSDVNGRWIIPSLTCNGTNTYSSAWVGIDGYSNSTVEQIGTEHDCTNGQSSYYAWYEMYPKMSRRIPLTIHAGDTIYGEVHYTNSNNFVLTLTNISTNQTYTTSQKAHVRRESAEWIVEAPWSGGTLPLANFGTIFLSGSQATINGHTGAINDAAWQNDPIIMTTSDGVTVKAQPSSLSTNGQDFSIVWHHN